MAYRIDISKPAAKELAKLPRAAQERVDKAIRALADDPRPPGVKAMQGEARGAYRIRVGDYRVIYEIADGRAIVLVIRVGDRREIYR